MRTPTDLSCTRGYEWWLMEQAKQRNPQIKLYALEWGAPGWFNGGFWSQDNITYLLSWLGCAQQHGLQINYLGGWNERGYNKTWYENLRAALNAHGFSNIQIVADDSFGWGVANAMKSDPAFNAAVDIVGQHYTCGYLSAYTSCPSTTTAQSLDKPLWASEQGSLPYDTGAAPLARAINREYIDGRVTGTINWSLEWSAYAGLPFPGDGLMLANTPWSGAYTVGPSIWAVAQTTQFTQPGWRYIDSASGYLSGGGSYVTLRSPSSSDYSAVVETLDATAPQQVTLSVTGGLSSGTVHVWSTNLGSADPAQWFVHEQNVQPAGGSYTVTLQPGRVYTLTTTTGQSKGTAASPAAAPWSLPYHENFDEYTNGVTPRYFSDLGGAFQTAPCAGGRLGMCLRQVITQQPIQWNSLDNFPLTVVGDPTSWQDYKVGVDALLEQPGNVELVGRATAPNNGVAGYHLRINDRGGWSLYSEGANGADTTLATGTATFGVNTWHRLELDMRGSEITALLDGNKLATALDDTYQTGQAALSVSAWQNAEFDNFDVTPYPTQGSRLSVQNIQPDPVSLAHPGDSAKISADVTNPGLLPATNLAVQAQAPQGWTATPAAAVPTELGAGQAAPARWTLTAPASAQPGSYQLTVVLTYESGGELWKTTKSIPVLLSLIPQSQMTATATSWHSGYEPSKAIDGDPNTMWHSEWSPYQALPQAITLNLGGTYNVSGLQYQPRIDSGGGSSNGIITSYNIYVSTDGKTFEKVASGTWALDKTQKAASFTASGIRYVRLEAVQGYNGYASAAEINIIGAASS